MASQPLFSIAIPTYNRLELLKRAVASALNQTYQNLEIIILNDASPDGTKAWLDELATKTNKVKIINHPVNVGVIKNVQSIPSLINGKYLVVLSDDDYLEAEFVENAVKDLEKHPDCTIWYCKTKVIDTTRGGIVTHNTQESPLCEDGYTFTKNYLLGIREMKWPATVFAVKTLKSIGGFLGSSITIDMVTTCSCAVRGEVFFNKKQLAVYNNVSSNITTNTSLLGWLEAMLVGAQALEKQLNGKLKVLLCVSLFRNCTDMIESKNKFKTFYIIIKFVFKNFPIQQALACFMIMLPRTLVTLFIPGKIRSLLKKQYQKVTKVFPGLKAIVN